MYLKNQTSHIPHKNVSAPYASSKAYNTGNAASAQAQYQLSQNNFSYAKEPSYTPSSFSNDFVASNEVQENAPKGFFQSLQYIGHIDHTYLLFRNDESLYVMDQHAAHERVLYTKFKNQGAVEKYSQTLLSPITLELGSEVFSLVTQNIQHFQKLGFELEEFGESSILIRSFPIHFSSQNPKEIFIEMCRDLESQNVLKSWNDKLDHIYSTMACHAAVRAHDVLSEVEIKHLLKSMDDGELSSYCPHGRPSYFKLGVHELEKMFKRI